jgi:hypothetical protein
MPLVVGGKGGVATASHCVARAVATLSDEYGNDI